MTDWTNFFNNPGGTISLFALVISILSLIRTFKNQKDQNFRWDKLNEGNPVIKEIRFQNWKELSSIEAKNIIWGYNPTIYAKGEATDSFVLPYFLKLRNAKDNLPIPNSNPIFTIEEVESELNRLGINEDVIISKIFSIKIEIENVGKTEIKNFDIQIDAKLMDQVHENIFQSKSKISLASNQKINLPFTLEIPIAMDLPEDIPLKIKLNYSNFKNENIFKSICPIWTAHDNYWSYGEW
jgi:hypothetical protein